MAPVAEFWGTSVKQLRTKKTKKLRCAQSPHGVKAVPEVCPWAAIAQCILVPFGSLYTIENVVTLCVLLPEAASRSFRAR
jgi:hypothetical protein